MNFYKYQGTGNDFIIIDDRNNNFPVQDTAYIKHLCERRFGIGADGLILIRTHSKADFAMLYFNADGKPGSMCGNGGRCAVAFANFLGIFSNTATFHAFDGMHTARFEDDNIVISMNDVNEPEIKNGSAYVMDTGSPHYVKLIDKDPGSEFVSLVKAIRNKQEYIREGINVNFLRIEGKDTLFLRTFERGVEDETWSCGTGVVAAAITASMHYSKSQVTEKYKIITPGGTLVVNMTYNQANKSFENIELKGPAIFVFKGILPGYD